MSHRKGRHFTTERDRLSWEATFADDDQGSDGAAPASAGDAEADLGDAVADLLDAQRGRTPAPIASPAVAHAPAPAVRRPRLGPSRDIGDEVADIIETRLYGAIRGA